MVALLSWRRAVLLVPAAAVASLFFISLLLRRPATRVLIPGSRIDVTSPVRLHGRVAKEGPLALLSSLPTLSRLEERWAAIDGESAADDLQRWEALGKLYYPSDWHERRQLGERPLAPAPVCPIAVSHKYKLIFLKNPKASGTSVMTYFTTCGADKQGWPVEEYCLAYQDAHNTTQARQLREMWQDYFVFTFVRNPLARTISQYQYLNFLMQDGCSVSWDRFCSDPYIPGDECHANSSCCSVGGAHHYLHVEPQSNCLLTGSGGLAVDFIGRSEVFTEDFAALIGVLNARVGVPPLPPVVPTKRENYNESPCNKTEAAAAAAAKSKARRQRQGPGRQMMWKEREGTFHPCDKRDYFRKRHAHCLPSIRSFFANDFRVLVD